MAKKTNKIKATHAELAQVLCVSVITVNRYRDTSPKKLELMMDGIW